MRGLGALYVMLFHAYFVFEACRSPMGAADPALLDNRWILASPLIGHGYLGVELFFILSGYVIYYVYAEGFLAPAPGRLAVFRTFFMHRVARVYPMHAVVLTVVCLHIALSVGNFHSVGAAETTPRYPTLMLALNYLLMQRIIPCPSIIVPAWSVSVEMLSYVLFPLMLVLFVAGGRLAAFGVVLLAFVALGRVEAHADGILHDFTDGYYPALRGVAGFALGMFAFQLSHWPEVRPVLRHPAFLVAAIVATVVLLGRDMDDRLTVTAFVLVVAAVGQDTAMANRLFCNRFFLWAGTISYSLYLIHMPLMPILIHLDRAVFWIVPRAWIAVLPIHAVFLAEYLIYAAPVLLVAALAYRWIEVPARRRLRFAFDRWAPAGLPEQQPTR